MTADEQARHRLHDRLDEVLGPDHAATLMSSLPPIDWTEIATKADLALLRLEVDQFRAEVDRRFATLEDRIGTEVTGAEHRVLGQMHQAMRQQTLTMVWANVGQIVAVGTIVLAAVKL